MGYTIARRNKRVTKHFRDHLNSNESFMRYLLEKLKNKITITLMLVCVCSFLQKQSQCKKVVMIITKQTLNMKVSLQLPEFNDIFPNLRKSTTFLSDSSFLQTKSQKMRKIQWQTILHTIINKTCEGAHCLFDFCQFQILCCWCGFYLVFISCPIIICYHLHPYFYTVCRSWQN